MSSYFANKTVLLPFDYSAEAERAVDKALEMVDDSTHVHVVHVLVPLNVVSIEPGALIDLGSDDQRIEAATAALHEQLGNKPRKLDFAARVGDPGSEIVEYANEIKADLIVMPSHGRSGLSRLLLGSVAERVLRLGSCPILILREPNRE